MTDVIDYLHKLIDRFNEEQNCGKCWVFTAPLDNATGNTYQIREENCDCVHFIVYRQRITETPTFGSVFHAIRNNVIRHTITFHVGVIAKFSENNWDEIKGYDIEDGRYKKYLLPIQKCLTTNNFNDFCRILGYPMRITSLNLETIANPKIYDENFVGYSGSITFEEQVR